MVYASKKGSRQGRGHRRANNANTAKIRHIVKKTLAATREKKHLVQSALDQVINTTGVNFDMVPKVGTGTGVSSRIGNEIQWKSYHVRMILKGGPNMPSAQVFRVIWYTPRTQSVLMPTTTSVVSFVDKEQFVIHSDKVHKIGTNLTRALPDDSASGVGAFKILNFGRKFKKPATMIFDDNTSASLLTNHMRCYIVSTSPSSSLAYTTSIDFLSTCYYTDA